MNLIDNYSNESDHDDADETNTIRQRKTLGRSPDAQTSAWWAAPTPYGETIMILLAVCLWLVIVLVGTVGV